MQELRWHVVERQQIRTWDWENMATDDGGHVVNCLRCLPHPAQQGQLLWLNYVLHDDWRTLVWWWTPLLFPPGTLVKLVIFGELDEVARHLRWLTTWSRVHEQFLLCTSLFETSSVIAFFTAKKGSKIKFATPKSLKGGGALCSKISSKGVCTPGGLLPWFCRIVLWTFVTWYMET